MRAQTVAHVVTPAAPAECPGFPPANWRQAKSCTGTLLSLGFKLVSSPLRVAASWRNKHFRYK